MNRENNNNGAETIAGKIKNWEKKRLFTTFCEMLLESFAHFLLLKVYKFS